LKVKAETLLFLSIKKIILGMAVLIIAIGATAIKYNRNAVNQEIGRYLYELSVQAKGKVDTRITSNFTILDTISKDVKEKQLTVEEIDNYVKYLGYAYPFNWIGYSDSKGNVKISKGKKDNLIKYSVIKDALSGKRGVSSEIVNVFGEKGILYAVPYNSKSNEKGAFIGFVPHYTMDLLLPSDAFSGEGFMHIINKEGDFILKSSNKNSEMIGGENYFEELLKNGSQMNNIKKVIEDIKTGKAGGSSFKYNSVMYSINYISSQEGNWYILTLVPTSIYDSQLVNYTRYNLEIIFISIVIFLILLYFLKMIEIKNREISKIAYEDPVTNGFTSAHFEIDVRKKLEEKEFKPFTFVSLDIRKFKLINESFGETRGNFVLKYVHDCIKKCLQEEESVSRISSDTFNIVFNSTDKEEIRCKIKQISALINKINSEIENPYYLSVDCGAYIVNNKNLNVIVIRDRANHARKNSKNEANTELFYNCIFYNNIEIENSLKEKNIEDNMEHALENNEFVVHFQPKVELKTNKIAGAEALVRWQDPKKGLIPPDEFIPIFEKNGFITKLDIYVFEEVCKTIRKWLNEGINPIPVSVNLSRMHLQNPNFLKKYKEIQEKYEVPADLLEIELTETLVFENFEQLKKVIDDIHQMGFSCSIDDFGSGYSSLNLLKEIPVDILKLDRIFFSKKNDKRGNSVIESIISLAKKLNMTTISEGVETISQVEFLRKADCDLVQGYVYSKPLAKDDFEITFLKNENIQVKKYKEKNKKIKRKQSK